MFARWRILTFPPCGRHRIGGRVYYSAGAFGMAAFRSAAFPRDDAFSRIPDRVGRLLPSPRAAHPQTRRDVNAVDQALPYPVKPFTLPRGWDRPLIFLAAALLIVLPARFANLTSRWRIGPAGASRARNRRAGPVTLTHRDVR